MVPIFSPGTSVSLNMAGHIMGLKKKCPYLVFQGSPFYFPVLLHPPPTGQVILGHCHSAGSSWVFDVATRQVSKAKCLWSTRDGNMKGFLTLRTTQIQIKGIFLK